MKLFLENLRLKLDPENLKDVLWSVKRFLKKTGRFFVKIVRYSKILWNDEDYDHAYILKLLQHKIKLTREHITQHGIVQDAPIIAKQMRYAEFLIQRLLDDNYREDLQNAHNNKWGDIIQYCDPPEPGKSYRKYHVIRKNATTPELEAQERSEQMTIYDAQENTRQKDFDRLFRHLRLYIQRWWD